jgi:GT2 family glycosyltransferase
MSAQSMDDFAKTATPAPTLETSVLAIIVLYKQLPTESPTVRTLLEAARIASSHCLRLSVLIADNTPGGQDVGILPDGVRYYAEPQNPGLAKPYNHALAVAEQEGFTWLLTLDQDTHLPANFLTAMSAHARQYESEDLVAGIVPRIADHGRLISPFRFVGGFIPVILNPTAKGISKRSTSALNSTSFLRVRALRQIGGYDIKFPLHNSDTNLFHRLDLAGKRLVVASDILVSHELAILNREDRMSPERYQQLLSDECYFWDLHMGILGRGERLIRLIGRACKGYLKNEDAAFQMITLREVKRRLFVRRTDRIKSGKATLTR